MSRARDNANNWSSDITGITAGTGMTGGSTSGSATVSLDTSSVYVVPNQTGNNGKYLTTDGTTSSWETLETDPTPTVLLLGGM